MRLYVALTGKNRTRRLAADKALPNAKLSGCCHWAWFKKITSNGSPLERWVRRERWHWRKSYERAAPPAADQRGKAQSQTNEPPPPNLETNNPATADELRELSLSAIKESPQAGNQPKKPKHPTCPALANVKLRGAPLGK